jgi:predicted nuclease with TOPRIM domain
MRVRISYSVDLEDVPSECARMLQENLEHLNEVHREIESLIDKLDDTETVAWQVKDQIDRCRQRLAKLDMVLADNDLILEGYYNAKNPKENEDVISEG